MPTMFQYYKQGTHGVSASDDQISQLPQHAATSATSWQHIIQVNSLHKLLMSNTLFKIIKLKKAVAWAFLGSGTTGHFLVN